MNNVLAVLRALRLLDDNNRVSLTNIALIAMVIYMMRCTQLTTQDMLAFAGALASYQFKRWVQPDAAGNDTEDMKKIVADLQTKVSSLQLGQSMRK